MSRHRSGKRPWLAAALAVVYPGFGHLYLREWLRALAWFGLMFATTALALPQSAVPDSGGLSLEAVMQATEQLPTTASLALLVLSILNIIDAYRLAKRRQTAPTADTSSEGPSAPATANRCPHCGHETDTEFDFCQWCGEPISADS